jgi:hypothetical protein
MNVSAGATGAEIMNDGVRVAAYHFGPSGITDITVNGVLFRNGGYVGGFLDSAMTGAWNPGGTTTAFAAVTDPAYSQLISPYVSPQHTGAAGGNPTTGPALSTLTLGGLIVGHTYRLQLISNLPRNAVVDVEGSTYTWLVGSTEKAELVSATWVAGDSELNVGWIGQAHAYYPTFNAYALHDMSGGTVPPYDTWGNGSFAIAFTDKDPTHDPDQDGLSNFQEFAFGLDPTTGASVNPITPLLGTQFSYTKWADSGLTYKVYYSTNLSDWIWDEFAGQSAAAPDGNGVSVVTVTLAAAAPVNGKLFVRVQASK